MGPYFSRFSCGLWSSNSLGEERRGDLTRAMRELLPFEAE